MKKEGQVSALSEAQRHTEQLDCGILEKGLVADPKWSHNRGGISNMPIYSRYGWETFTKVLSVLLRLHVFISLLKTFYRWAGRNQICVSLSCRCVAALITLMRVHFCLCRLRGLCMWERPLVEHHPDHAPLPRLLQWPAGQTHHSISFTKPPNQTMPLAWFEHQMQHGIRPLSLCVLLSFGCQQQRAIKLVLGLQCRL